tara:strand:+ start:215 stop:400 length:186 start_codon:yes stop_codon:yes gene_type:complete
MKIKNWIYYMQQGLKSMWRKKEKEYPYNIEFGDGRTKEEMDKMQEELMKCGCLPDCGCKEA